VILAAAGGATQAPTPLAWVEPGFVPRTRGRQGNLAPTPLAGVEPRFLASPLVSEVSLPRRDPQEMNRNSTPASGVGVNSGPAPSGYEPQLHPGERGGGHQRRARKWPKSCYFLSSFLPSSPSAFSRK
jgi:hypothetical protein